MENGTVEKGVCSSESVNGSPDIWSCKDSHSLSIDHLVAMVHGIFGRLASYHIYCYLDHFKPGISRDSILKLCLMVA